MAEMAAPGFARLRRIFLCATAVLVAATLPAGTATVPAEVIVSGWAKQTKHPLAGRILRTGSGQLIDGIAASNEATIPNAIAAALGIRGPAFVLLGEVHDNAEHHWLRAGLIPPLGEPSAYGPLYHPGVVSEHIDDSKAGLLQGLGVGEERTTDKLFAALEWNKSGWPASKMFEPLFATIFEKRLPLIPGNVPGTEVRALAREGRNAVAPHRNARLGLGRELPDALMRALLAELKGSHCGLLPESALPGMALAQQVRDASMGYAMVQAVESHGRAILLAGNGHVRTDRGVPWHIRALKPDAVIVAVLLAEVEDGRNEAAAYLPRDPDGRPAVDAVIFTPRAAREDPCVKMRARMQVAPTTEKK
jgi:uncharacterized iron-regulated protein